MTTTLKTALLVALLGAAVSPAFAQDRAPRSGGPTTTVILTELAPIDRRPRAGAEVATPVPASSEVAFQAAGAVLVDATDGPDSMGLCGRKYCGGGSGR